MCVCVCDVFENDCDESLRDPLHTHIYINDHGTVDGTKREKKNRRDLNKKGQNGKWVVECCLMYYQQHRLWGEGEEERIKKGNMCVCVLRFSSIL